MEYWFMPNKKLTGQAIKKHRLAKGWSAAKLGEALGNYSDRTVYKWENGKSFPSLENILKIAYLLDVMGQDILLPKSICRFSKTDTYCVRSHIVNIHATFYKKLLIPGCQGEKGIR